MKKTAIIIGSPKIQNSTSEHIAQQLQYLLPIPVPMYHEMDFRLGKESYETIFAYEQLLIIAPLYIDELPANLICFLEELSVLQQERHQSFLIYAVFNCGFFEGNQNTSAIEILHEFADENDSCFCGGIGIGGGGMLSQIPASAWKKEPIKPIYRALCGLVQALQESRDMTVRYVQPHIPRYLYLKCAHVGWHKLLKQNGKRRKDIWQKQYYQK